MKIKLSKSQWEKIGRTAGWMKEAMFGVMDTEELPRYYVDREKGQIGVRDRLTNNHKLAIDQKDAEHLAKELNIKEKGDYLFGDGKTGAYD